MEITGEEYLHQLTIYNTTNDDVEVELSHRHSIQQPLLVFMLAAGDRYIWQAQPGGGIKCNDPASPVDLKTEPAGYKLTRRSIAQGSGIIEVDVAAAFVGENDPYRCGTTNSGVQCTKPLGHDGLHNYYAVHSPDEQGMPEPVYEEEWYEPCDDPTEWWLDDEPMEPLQPTTDEVGDQVILTNKTFKTASLSLTGTWKSTTVGSSSATDVDTQELPF